jgi:hypothetical protein
MLRQVRRCDIATAGTVDRDSTVVSGAPRVPDLRLVVPSAARRQLSQSKKGDRQKRTYAELIADAQIRKALRGDTMAAKEVTDRVEGKARQAVDIGLEPMPDLNLRVCFIKSCAECAGKGLKYCPSGRPMAKASTREARDRPFRLL